MKGGDGEAAVPTDALWGLDAGPGRPEIPAAAAGFASAAGIRAAALGTGHINVFPDADGVYRRIPLFLRVSTGFVPSLSLRTACGYLGVDSRNVEAQGGRRIVLRGAAYPDGREKDIAIPVDSTGALLLDLPGTWADSFPHYPAAQVLEAGGDPAVLSALRDEMEGDIVVLSDVSSAGKDYGPTALEEYYPLSGLHAKAVSSILRGEFLMPPPPLLRLIATVLLAALLFLVSRCVSGADFLQPPQLRCASRRGHHPVPLPADCRRRRAARYWACCSPLPLSPPPRSWTRSGRRPPFGRGSSTTSPRRS